MKEDKLYRSDLRVTLVVVLLIAIYFTITISHTWITGLHTWRQSDVASVARNFASVNMNIFYPRVSVYHSISLPASLSGVVGMEFPLYNFIVALMYKFSHVQWLGFAKLLSAACSLSIVYLLCLILRKDTEGKSKFDLPILLCIAYSMKYFMSMSCAIMPEMLGLFLAVLGFYYYYDRQRRSAALYFSIFCFSLSFLIRPYFIFFGIPILCDFIYHLRHSWRDSLRLLGAGVTILLPFVLWYFYWVPNLNSSTPLGGYFYMGSSVYQNVLQYPQNLFGQTKELLCSYFMFIFSPFFIYGIWCVFKCRRMNSKAYFLSCRLLIVAAASYFILPLVIGNHFSPHFYFLAAEFPAILLFSFYGLYALCFSSKFSRVGIIAFSVLFFLNFTWIIVYASRLGDLKVGRNIALLINNNNAISKIINPHDAVALVGTKNPVYLYVLHHRGWVIPSLGYGKKRRANLIELKKNGAKYIMYMPKRGPDGRYHYSVYDIDKIA